MHRYFVTETFEPQSNTAATHLGLVMLPALQPVLQSAGFRIITDEQFQIAAKKITESLKNAPFPVIVSNKGQSALLRTWTRNVTRLANHVVVVALTGGYTEFPDGVIVLHAPVSVNEILAAAAYSNSPNFDGLFVNIDGNVVRQATSVTFDDLEEVEKRPVAEPEYETAPVIPSFEDIPDESDFTVVDEDLAATDFIPDIPDIPTDFSTFNTPVPTEETPVSIPVDTPPIQDEELVSSEPEYKVTSSVVIPESVYAAAAAKHDGWVYEIDQYAPTEYPPTAVVGAWWSDSAGDVDDTSFQPNPHYVPCVVPVSELVAEFVRPDPFSETNVDEPVQTVSDIDQFAPATSDTTFDELPELEDYPSLTVEETVQPDIQPDIFEAPVPEAEYRVPESQDEVEPEPVYVPVLTPVEPTPATPQPEPVAPEPVYVPTPTPVEFEPVDIPAAIVIPPLAPIVSVSPEVPKVSDNSLLAPPSNYKPLNEYIEPTSLTAGDNTFAVGSSDDSYLSVRNRPHGKGDVAVIWSGKGGVGKAQNPETAVKTPSGWTTMGELSVGDFVFGRDGKPALIQHIFDYDDLEMFDVHLSDGQVIRSCADHHWVVSGYYDRLNAEHQKRFNSIDRWDAVHVYADRLIEIADGFSDTDVISITDLFKTANIDGCPWNTSGGMSQLLAELAINKQPTVEQDRTIIVYQTFDFLTAVIETWDKTASNHSLRNYKDRHDVLIQAAKSVLASDFPATESASGIARLLESHCDIEPISPRGLVKAARSARFIEGSNEVRTFTHGSSSIRSLPTKIALKTLASAVLGQVAEQRPTTAPRERIMTTAEMLSEGVKVMKVNKPTSNFSIRLTEAVQFPEANLRLDPHLLGIWLGDGTTIAGSITQGATEECTDPETGLTDRQFMVDRFHENGYTTCVNAKYNSIYVRRLKVDLRAIGVLGFKHIPDIYMNSSVGQRLALLQGLMDTDGTIALDGGCELSLCDKRLATDAHELIRSLGIKAAMHEAPAAITEDDPDNPGQKRRRVTSTRYRITFTTTTQVFQLPRKARRTKEATRKTQDFLYITDITPAGQGPGRCIAVDSPDHTFLVAQFVPTHNSTIAYSLAQRAATQGKRVVLIDGNFGQGDLRQYLRLTTANIPSVYDTAVSRNLKDAFIGPDTINQYRADGLDDIRFVYVAAPPPHLADISVVTPELYAAIIAEATHFADLIFVDTQIIETVDATGMVDRLIAPLLVERAWGIGVSDLSAPGIANMMRRLDNFAEDGVPPARQLTLLNRVPSTGGFNADKLSAALSKHSIYVGAVQDDENIHNQMNLGRTVSDSPGLAPLLDNILARIAGLQPPQVTYTSARQSKSKRRFFRRNK